MPNKFAVSFLVSAALAGSLAAAAPALAEAAGNASTSRSASCVQLLGWSTNTNLGVRYVKVHNNCGSKKCYRVVQSGGNPLLSVAAYATETDGYSSTVFPQGTGIYDASCTGLASLSPEF
ncbi:hypothetical protein Mame01_02690 [Microbispora amethystogenes]|nr:hypothetical protein Mame01_02690 [Microbispora amethystogenes]